LLIAKISALSKRFEGVDARLDGIGIRLDDMTSELTAIVTLQSCIKSHVNTKSGKWLEQSVISLRNCSEINLSTFSSKTCSTISYVVQLMMPPLRERINYIPLLGEHFCWKYHAGGQAAPATVSPTSLKALMNYQFPCNIR